MAGEAATLTDMRNTAIPAVELHRDGVTSLDNGTPDAADYAVNHGRWPRCRVYLDPSFVNGTNPALTFRIWARRPLCATEPLQPAGLLLVPNGATTSAFTIVTGGPVAIDVPANGDDLFVEVYAVGGTPTSYALDCYLSWRP